MNRYIVFAGMGMELVGIIVGCLYLGQKLDEIWGLHNISFIVLSMLGLVGWIVQIIWLTKKLEKDGP